MEENLEELDSFKPEDETEDSPNLEQPDEVDKLATLAEQNKQLYARAKKAEEEAKTLKSQKEVNPPKTIAPTIDVDAIIAQKFEERDLESLELSDELKAETKAYATAKGISVRAASESEYLKFLKSQAKAKAREEEASASTKGTGKSAKRDFSSLSEGDVQKMDSDEFAAYTGWLKSQG